MANNLTAELILDIKRFRKGIIDAQNLTRKGFSGKGMSSGIASAGPAITKALAGVMAVAAGVAGYQAGRIIAASVKGAAENERFQMRFEVLTGSRGAGNRVLNEIREDAMRTGVAVSDMADNVGKFMAFGFDPDKALALNKGILDVGGAVGLTTRDMKLLGVALSQVAAKGVLNMEEARQQIAEKGIPIFKALEQQLGVTGAELNKMIQEGKVSAETVMKLFTDIGKGEGPFARFQGGAEKMAATFEGTINRIKMVWQEFLRVLGNPILDALKPILDGVLERFDGMRQYANGIGVEIANWVSYATAFVSVLSGMKLKEVGSMILESLIFAAKSFGNILVKFGRYFASTTIELLSRGFRLFVATNLKMLVDYINMVAINPFKKASDPSFWNKMKEGLDTLGLIFGKIVIKGVAMALQSMKKAGGIVGAAVGKAGDKMMNDSVIAAGTLAKGFNKATGPLLDLYNNAPGFLDSTKDALTPDAIKKLMGDKWQEAFSSGDMFDTGNGELSMKKFLDEVSKLAEKLREARQEATRARNTTKGKALGQTGSATAPGGGVGGFALNSRLSQAINTIAGRSAYEVLAVEARKQNALLGKIEKNTRPGQNAPKLISQGGNMQAVYTF